MGPVGPRWSPCWPHGPCYQGGYCLTAPSHRLNQFWLTINAILWPGPLTFISVCTFELTATSPRRQWVATSHTWWRHQMETFSALLALCAGNSPVTGEFPSQRPVTRSFDVFFHLCGNKRLSKQSWGWWFETLSRSLWRHCNVEIIYFVTRSSIYDIFLTSLCPKLHITVTSYNPQSYHIKSPTLHCLLDRFCRLTSKKT